MAAQSKMKTVFTVVERDKKSHWVKLGVGFVNQDGSINLKLDGFPTSGQLQVRDYESPEEREARFSGRGAAHAHESSFAGLA